MKDAFFARFSEVGGTGQAVRNEWEKLFLTPQFDKKCRMTSAHSFGSYRCSQYGLTDTALACNNEKRKWELKIAVQFDAPSPLCARLLG